MFPEKLIAAGMKLAELCNARKELEALDTLYAEDCVSVEALPMGEAGRDTRGLEALRGKHDWWYGVNDVNAFHADGPYFFGDDQFSLIFDMDVTNKESGERSKMREVGVYTVTDGKISREEFFYPAMG